MGPPITPLQAEHVVPIVAIVVGVFVWVMVAWLLWISTRPDKKG